MSPRFAPFVERIAHERELREAQLAAFDHERELRAVYDQHERELRRANEEAVEKARAEHDKVIDLHLDQLNHAAERIDRMTATFMTTDRFDREHAALIERIDGAFARINAQLATEERVTARQDAQLDIRSQVGTSQRWLIGIAVSSGLTLFVLALHLVGVY